jgi:hypothetical protein
MRNKDDKPPKTGRKRQVRRKNRQNGNVRPRLTAFLFDSIFQVVTWVGIAACLGAIFYFLSKDNMRGTYWGGAGLVILILLMIAMVGDRHFFQNSSAQPTISPTSARTKERPYVFIHENALTKPLTGGQPISIRTVYENTGPGEVRVTFKNSTAAFRVDDNRSLKYAPYDPAATVSFTIPPQRRSETFFSFRDPLFTDEDIKGLHDGRAKLYFFARGEFKDESGRKYPLDFRFVYDPESGGLFVCADSITIDD